LNLSTALEFLDRQGRPVDAAWARFRRADSPREAVLEALAAFQNPDGGFGQNLEPDIKAPDSQPFAARLAMDILLTVDARPNEPVVRALAGWLDAAQDEDGCWRFPPGVYEHALAPWFAGWTFPSLNPALDLAGYATRLGIGSAAMHARVRSLADGMATLEEAETGEFYNRLPYVEYFQWVEHPEREAYLDAIVTGIIATDAAGGYPDAAHFFDHAGPADGPIARRLAPDLIAGWLDRMAEEPEADSGWPSAYDPAWRSPTTAKNLVTLADYGRV